MRAGVARVVCDTCGAACGSACAAMQFEDKAPGEVQRMVKTRHDRGVWAGSKALIYDDDFPSLYDASNRSRGSVDASSSTREAKFQYNWKQWLANLKGLLHNNLPPSCGRMVRLLHHHYGYDYVRMRKLAPQLAKAVIELEYRRSEKRRTYASGSPSVDSDDSLSGSNRETQLMTRVRSACTHKHTHVVSFLENIIELCYQLINEAVPPFGTTLESASDFMGTPAPDPAAAYVQHEFPAFDSVVSGASMAFPSPVQQPADMIGFGMGSEAAYLIPVDELNMPDSDLLGPAGTDQSEPFEELRMEPVPGLNPFMSHALHARGDPLAVVMVLCQLGDTVQAVQYFKQALDCFDMAITSEQARQRGVTPWHYTWLKLGEEVSRRERQMDRNGRTMTPSTQQLLCELDTVFAELECEREYGEFTEAAANTLDMYIAQGNFAAKATKGLLLLGADADVCGSVNTVSGNFESEEAREEAGLKLVLDAMKTDVWTVPRLLVQRVQNRHIPLRPETTRKIVEAIRERAQYCSVVSLHLGLLLSYELAHEVHYVLDVRGAKVALRSCLGGVDVPRDIRLHCMRKLGRLVTFGVGGIGVDLAEANRVLSKGVEAKDTFCIAHLANVRLREHNSEMAVALFRRLFEKDEREVFISAHLDQSRTAWETYRIHVSEAEESSFLSHVSSGACLPVVMTRDRARAYGDLMVIELHEHGLPPHT